MKKKFFTFINTLNLLVINKILLKPIYPVVIAFSGGQDSICLLILFYILKNQWNFKIATIYCNHLWHKDVFHTFLHLAKISFNFKIYTVYSINVKFLYSEKQARNWRLKIYLRFLNFFHFNLIVTGHTESDQIETFFFNITKGSSLKGASAIKRIQNLQKTKQFPFFISKIKCFVFLNLKKKLIFDFFLKKSKISFLPLKKKIKILFLQKKIFYFNKKITEKNFIVRPLLKKSRFEMKKISQKLKIPLFPDKSNQRTIYTRNRIRKQLLPSLRFFLNPQFDVSLFRYNEIFVQEELIIINLLKKIVPKILIEHQKYYSINFCLFYSFPTAIQRKVCFLFFKKKLSIKAKFYTINSSLYLVKKTFSNKIKTIKKRVQQLSVYRLCNYFFVPQIGIIFFYKKLIIFIK